MVESLESTYYKTTIVVLNFGINLTQPLCYFLFTQFPSLGAIEENANILSRLSQMYLKRLFLDLIQISSGLLGPDPGNFWL